MLQFINRIFVAFLLVLAVVGITISLLMLFLPDPSFGLFDSDVFGSMESNTNFVLISNLDNVDSDNSPFLVNYTIKTPKLREFDLLSLEIYSGGQYMASIDCLEQYDDYSDYEDITEFTCAASIPYHYSNMQNYSIYATLYGEYYEYMSGPEELSVNWSGYESYFGYLALIMILLVIGVYVVILLPLTILIIYLASKTRRSHTSNIHYTISTPFNPFSSGKTILQKFNAFLVSPYFWIFEIIGIFIILFYMVVSGQVWKSPNAFIAFILSGLMAFIVPYIWCLTWWYADFKEREPLRVLVTFFLWGMCCVA